MDEWTFLLSSPRLQHCCFPVCFRELGPETKELRVRLLERNGKRERKAFFFFDSNLPLAAIPKADQQEC